jgi:hypothetical protein
LDFFSSSSITFFQIGQSFLTCPFQQQKHLMLLCLNSLFWL